MTMKRIELIFYTHEVQVLTIRLHYHIFSITKLKLLLILHMLPIKELI